MSLQVTQQTNLVQQIGSTLGEMVERWRERLAELVLPLVNHFALQKQLDRTSIGKIARMVQQKLAQSNAVVSETKIMAEINAAAAKVVPLKKEADSFDAPDDSHFTPAQKLHIKEFFVMADSILASGDEKAYRQLLMLAKEDKILTPYHVQQLQMKARAA